ncbi:MAG: DUF3795 domain-containing protein [Candidatus Verstraetearchaeota archaeon]|nr:DUF3795 domain-containing protein [Candidatus Verstraetearchaeota archaeon]
MSDGFTPELISRCGINCRTCVGYFGYRLDGQRQAPCGGCLTREKFCGFVKDYCKKHADKDKIRYCSECEDFPCENFRKIDEYYSGKYGVSLIENFNHIKSKGMEDFLRSERARWKCAACGGVVCVHTKRCYTCKP